MNILVTGGAGYIGSHVVDELISNGHNPIVVDTMVNSDPIIYEGLKKITGQNVTHYKEDVRNTSAIAKILERHDCSAVIHLAAFKSVGESMYQLLNYYDNNVSGLVSVLEAMQQAGVNQIIYSSSTTVYGSPDSLPMTESSPIKPPTNPYGATKQMCEQIIQDACKTTGMRAVLLRYFNPVGAHPSSFIGELPLGVPSFLLPYIMQTVNGMRSELTIYGGDYDTVDGTPVRDYVHVVDLATAHISALDYLNKTDERVGVFNIGTGKGTSVLQFVKTFEKANGIKVPYKIGPRREGDVATSYASADKAWKVLGWRAKLSLEQALGDAWNWQKYLNKKNFMTSKSIKVLVTTSSFPVSDNDEVPAFVKDQIVDIKKRFPNVDFIVHTPHNYYSDTVHNIKPNEYYKEFRYHYFRPYRLELLVGRGIMPALKQNKLLYLEIPFFVLFEFLSLLWLTLRHKPDLIYAHWFMPQAITSALVSKITRTPFVFTTHASDVSVLRSMPLASRLIRWVCKQASAYTAVSERTANKLKWSLNKDDWERNFDSKLSILPMGVKTNLNTMPKQSVEAVAKKFDLPKNKDYLLFVGRLAEKKGVEYLLKAIPELDPSVSDKLHFIIAGNGQLYGPLKALASKLGIKNVTFTGYVHGQDKDALFKLAAYTCFPSIIDSRQDAEGFPVTIMEGLAAGKIVLASDASGGESIMPNGVAGLIFKQKSARAIVEAITKAYQLSEDKKRSMEAEAKKLSARFDWSVISDRHYQIFKRVLEGER